MTASHPSAGAASSSPMRRYIRHPSDIPIDVRPREAPPQGRDHLRNIGRGGLCFVSPVPIDPGRHLGIQVPLERPVFETAGVVAWCRPAGEAYEVGVRFFKADAEANRRFVARVREVERYKMDVWVREGRTVSGEEAAREWLGSRP